MIDAKDRALGKDFAERGVERPRRYEIVSEGLLDGDPRALDDADASELLDDNGKQAGRNRKIVERMLRIIECALQLDVRRGVLQVAPDIAYARCEITDKRAARLCALVELSAHGAAHYTGFAPGHGDQRDLEGAAS